MCEATPEEWSTQLEESDFILKKETSRNNIQKLFTTTAEFLS